MRWRMVGGHGRHGAVATHRAIENTKVVEGRVPVDRLDVASGVVEQSLDRCLEALGCLPRPPDCRDTSRVAFGWVSATSALAMSTAIGVRSRG